MHTPRIQNMSISELYDEAKATDNELALKMYESLNGDDEGIKVLSVCVLCGGEVDD